MLRGLILLIAAGCTGADRSPVEVLARMGRIVTEDAARFPNYTCVETVERRYYRANLTGSPRNCDDLSAAKKKRGYKLVLESTDRLRLNVRAGAIAEMFSWPGANRFEDRELERIIGYGPAATGSFGTLLLSIFQGDAADFVFLGGTESAGRKLFAYSFRVPEDRSHFHIHTSPGDSIVAGYEGTILADPDTAEPVRLTTHTAELSSQAFCCEMSSSFEYGRVRIGADEFLLPKEARRRFMERSGIETENITTFSGCREYNAGSAPEKPLPPLEIRAGLPVAIALGARIDSASAAAGDPFTGTLAKPALDAGKTVLPEGALINGRLTKVEVRTQPAVVIIGFQVDTVQVGGAAVPLYLRGKPPDSRSGLQKVLSSLNIGGGGVSTRRSTTAPVLGETRSSELRFTGKHVVLDRGFQTDWITVKP